MMILILCRLFFGNIDSYYNLLMEPRDFVCLHPAIAWGVLVTKYTIKLYGKSLNNSKIHFFAYKELADKQTDKRRTREATM